MNYLKKEPPKLAVNTHYHEDHIAANKPIQEQFRIGIYAHPLSIPLIGRPATLFSYQEFTWGYPEPSTVLPIPTVIQTDRSHSKSSSFLDIARIILASSNDHRGGVLQDTVVGRSVRTLRPEEDIGEIVASHRKLSDLETERLVLLTSSGKIFEEGRKTMADFAQFIDGILQKSRDLHNSGKSEDEIVKALFGGEDPRAALTNNQFSSANLIRSVLKVSKPCT